MSGCASLNTDGQFFGRFSRMLKKTFQHPARRQFSVKVGTVFEDSPIGLDKWFTAVWMIANCQNGISSYEIARDLVVTQKTAWFMLHRMRLAMQTGTFEKVTGKFEADESFIGGLARNMHKHKKAKITGTGGAGKATAEKREARTSQVSALFFLNRRALRQRASSASTSFLGTDTTPRISFWKRSNGVAGLSAFGFGSINLCCAF